MTTTARQEQLSLSLSFILGELAPRETSVGVILSETMTAEDADTIRAVLAGDTSRFAELVDKYQQQAMRVAFSLLGNWDDAKDAAQEAFVSAYQALGRFDGRAKFSTWFYRIVVNKAYDAARRRLRSPQTVAVIGPVDPEDDDPQLFADIEDPDIAPERQAHDREFARALSRAVLNLSLQQRAAFVLHHVQGFSLEEVAQLMQCRVGTVKSHVFRATTALREQLAPWQEQAGG